MYLKYQTVSGQSSLPQVEANYLMLFKPFPVCINHMECQKKTYTNKNRPICRMVLKGHYERSMINQQISCVFKKYWYHSRGPKGLICGQRPYTGARPALNCRPLFLCSSYDNVISGCLCPEYD